MKPHQLIAALMHREGLGPLPLAKKMGKPKLQPQIHRFITGQVANPQRSTAVPLAAYFRLPVDAIYEERVAVAIARERGIEALPPQAEIETAAGSRKRRPAFDDDVLDQARQLAAMTPEERLRLRALMIEAKALPIQIGNVTELPQAPAGGLRKTRGQKQRSQTPAANKTKRSG